MRNRSKIELILAVESRKHTREQLNRMRRLRFFESGSHLDNRLDTGQKLRIRKAGVD